MQRTSNPKPASQRPPPAPIKRLTADWAELQKNVMICSGNYSQAHKRYRALGQQGVAVCIVACGVAGLKSMETWTRKVLDDILEVGSNLFLKTKLLCENRHKVIFKPSEICKCFFLGATKVSMKIGDDSVSARVPRDCTLIQKVQDLLDLFFQTENSGIFICANSYFAVWKLGKFFYVFDPTDHDEKGGKWTKIPGSGFCYCLRCTNTNFLADLLVKNCPLRQVNKFSIYPCSLVRLVKIDTKPPEDSSGCRIPREVTSRLKKPLLSSKMVEKEKKPLVPKPVEKKESIKEEKKEEPLAKEVPEEKPPETEVKPAPPPVQRKPRFPPERPRLRSVANFQRVAPGCGILRASTHQRDPKFTKYMGRQSFGNSLAALTMLRQYQSNVWIRKIVDEVLKLGEVIHSNMRKLPPGELVKKIVVNDAEYSPKIEKYGVVGRLTSDTDSVLNLEQAIQETLLENDCCILVGPQVVALWKEDNKFYMFDPEERDSSGRKVEGQPGVACVTWFTTVQPLVELYLGNLPKTSRKDRFMLNKVTIDDYVALEEDWCNFKALTPKKWILRGTISQQDRRFPPESRNTQCTVNSTMALTFKELKEEKDWDATVVDQVLIKGDELYRDCVNYLQECGRFKHRFLMVDEVKRNFDVENKRVMLEVDDCLVNGVLNARSDTGIPNLRRGFEEFFTESDAGIVTANSLSMAVWKKNDIYYYYDSHSRNEKGIVCGYGTACILRMVTIEDLANALLVNLGPDSMNLYNISRVVVKLMDFTKEGVVKPPLNSFKSLSDVLAILRSTVSYRDKKFNISAGKQEVPMCLAALAFNSVTAADEWTVEDLDQVLVFGDKLYRESMEANYAEDVPEELNVDEVSTNNVKKEMNIGPNKMYFEFEEVASGTIDGTLKEALDNLKDEEAFSAILESPYIVASIWRDVNSFFVFDPRPRDERGQVYGKDEWSVKIEIPMEEQEPESEQEAETEGGEPGPPPEAVEKEEGDENAAIDEMAGGDNLGEPEPEQEQEIAQTEYEATEIPPPPQEEVVVEEQQQQGAEAIAEEEEEGYEEDEAESVVEKKPSSFWRRLEETKGKSCVLRFSRLEDLIDHLVESSPPNKQRELEFSFKRVQLSNTPKLREVRRPEDVEKKDEIVGDWNNFTEVDYGKWILRSSRNFRDALFPICNRGRQALPMAMVSTVFAFLYDLPVFNKRTVDSILAYGDRLFTVARNLTTKTLKDNKDLGLADDEVEAIVKDTKYHVDSFPRKLCIGEKLAKWEVKKEAITGDMTSRINEVYNLVEGLKAFFEENQYGVLTSREYPVGVWKSDEFFYMFDSHPTGPSGITSPVGVSCVTRFKSIEDLVDIFRKNIAGKLADNFFYIDAFTFEQEPYIRKCPPEEKPTKTKPEFVGGFTFVTTGKSILRGDLKQDYTKFDRGVHVHSAPIAFVALALSLCKDPETWTRIIVNEILRLGEDLYLETVDKLGDKFDAWSQRLNVHQVNTDFHIGKLKVNSAIRYTEQRGIVSGANPKVLSLRQGLERFFTENSHGILVADKFILGVWEQVKGTDTNIFMFDPNSRGGTGLPGQGGVACAMKFCNAKLAADHVRACMMDIDKTKTEFIISPVELVVGESRSKRKIHPPKEDNCPCPSKPKPITVSNINKDKECKKTFTLEQPSLRKTLAEERCRKEKQRCATLARHGFHEISDNQVILRGLRAILPDRELPVNLVAFVFIKVAKDVNKWNYKQIELILEAGYQLYMDSVNTYKVGNTKLTLETVLRYILLQDFEVKIEIKKPIVGYKFTRENLLSHLSKFFMVATFCMVNYKNILVSVYFKSGYYFLFDPYSRDLNGDKTKDGAAMLMRFGELGELVEKVVKNLREDCDPPDIRYALIVVGISSVKRLETCRKV